MLSNYTQAHKDALSILDSDDDLPDSYEETSEIPAYLNDSRFNNIDLPWLADCKPITLPNKLQQQKLCREELPARTDKKEEPERKEESFFTDENYESKILISQGTLTKRDLFFVKSIEGHCSESTMIWFIESLKNKSVSNRFRSCLANNIYDVDSSDDKLMFDSFNANYYFELVISK